MLVGSNGTNTWAITGENAGTLNSQINFSSVEDLTGGSGRDDFIFAEGGSADGVVDGGTGGPNTLDYSGTDSGVTVILGLNTDHIDAVLGGSGSDTFIGLPYDSIWNILSMDGGRYIATDEDGNVSADVVLGGIENLEGGIDDDTFLFADGMGVKGTIDGGGGTNRLDYSAYTSANSVTVNLGSGGATGASGVTNIQSITGGAGSNDTLIGPDADSTWNITGANSGDVGGVNFAGFENLTGAADNEDGFILHISGSLSGTLEGGLMGLDAFAIEDPGSPGSFVIIVPDSTGDGTLIFDDVFAEDLRTIIYSGMEPSFFVDAGDPDNITVNTSFLTEDMVLEAGPGTDQLQLRIDGSSGSTTRVWDVAAGAFGSTTLVFDIPSGSMSIDLRGGNDTLTVSSVNTPGSDLKMSGESILLNGDIISYGGDIFVTADNITVAAGVIISTRYAVGDQQTAESLGDSGDLTLSGRTITVNSDANLLTFDNRPLATDPLGIPAGIDNQSLETDVQTNEKLLWTPGKSYTGLLTTSSGSGTGLKVNVVTDTGGNPTVYIHTRGAGYVDDEMITIEDPDNIGGKITVQINGLLQAGGDIELTAIDHFLTWAYVPSHANTRIEINGAILRGRDIIIRADADNDTNYDGEASKGQQIAESALDFFGNLRPLVGVSKAKSTADILIGSGTYIQSDADVIVNAISNSEANVFTLGIGAGVGYARSEADATVTVAGGATIHGDGDVSLSSSTENAVSVAGIDMLLGKLLPAHIVFAMTEAYSHATTTVAQGAQITAGGNVNVQALNTKNLSSTVSCGGDKDYVGVGILIALSDATAEANVNGTVTSISGDVSLLAQVDTAKNINKAQSVHGDSWFGKITGYLSDATPLKAGKDVLKAGGTWAWDKISTKYKGRQRSNAISERPEDPKFGASAAVTYGEHTNSAAAKIGSSAVVSAGRDVKVEAKVIDRPDITAASVVAAATDKYNKTHKREMQKDVVGSFAVLWGDFNNHSYAAIESGATVDALGDILVQSDTVIPYQTIWGNMKQIGLDYKNLISAITLADIGPNSFVSSWAFSAAQGKKAGIAGSVSIVNFNNTSDALIGEGALINQNTDVAGQDVTVKAKIDFEAVNLVGNYPRVIKKLNLDSRDGRNGEYKGKSSGVGGSFGGYFYTNTTTAAIESGAKVNAATLMVDAQTITKNLTLGLAGSDVAATYAFNGAVTLVEMDNHTLAKIDDGAFVTADGDINVTALDDALNVNFAGAVLQGRSLGFGITAGVNLINRDTKAIVGNQESVLGRGEFAPSTGVNDVDNTIDLGYAHGFNNGEMVVYSNGGGGSIGGLVDGDNYYVRIINSTTVKLARSIEEANEDPVTFFSSAEVDDAEEVETIDLGYVHGYQTGDPVVYYNGGGEDIGGLTDGKTYYVIRISDTQVQLAELLDDALSETPVPVNLDLTLGGSGTTGHSLRLDLDPSIGSGSSHSLGIGFDPSAAVSNAEGSINLGYEHGFVTGQEVTYSHGGGKSIGGLENKGTYYVIVVDPTTIRLAESQWKALEGVYIDLDSSAAEGTSHTIGAEFQPIPIVDGNTDTIRFQGAHGFREGQAIVYDSGGGTPIGGLTSGEKYYVNRIDAHTIKLARTAGGEALALDPSVATGTGHRLFEPDDVNGSLSSGGETTIGAENKGLIVNVTLAASKTGDKPSSKEEKSGKEAPGGGGTYGVALSGSASANTVFDITEAYISDSVITQSNGLEVKATESTVDRGGFGRGSPFDQPEGHLRARGRSHGQLDRQRNTRLHPQFDPEKHRDAHAPQRSDRPDHWSCRRPLRGHEGYGHCRFRRGQSDFQ